MFAKGTHTLTKICPVLVACCNLTLGRLRRMLPRVDELQVVSILLSSGGSLSPPLEYSLLTPSSPSADLARRRLVYSIASSSPSIGTNFTYWWQAS
jgi:hypothetical protein